jgi:GNAT superfamily N-acetyltransferase
MEKESEVSLLAKAKNSPFNRSLSKEQKQAIADHYQDLIAPIRLNESDQVDTVLGEKVASNEKISAAKVLHLTSPEQIEQAKKLERTVFGGASRSNGSHAHFGIYESDKLVATTCVNTEPLKQWKNDESLKTLQGLKPNIWITSTSVHPNHRGKGYATALRSHLQNQYGSILTGTGYKSDPAMQHLNEKAGFKKVLERGKSITWHWSKEELEKTSEAAKGIPSQTCITDRDTGRRYNLQKLWKETSKLPVENIPVASLDYMMRKKVWGRGTPTPISPKDLLSGKGPKKSRDLHSTLVDSADLSYPTDLLSLILKMMIKMIFLILMENGKSITVNFMVWIPAIILLLAKKKMNTLHVEKKS